MIMDLKIRIEDEQYEIILTGSVIVPANDFIQFNIENLSFRFQFTPNDQPNPETGGIESIEETDEHGSRIMSIILSNMDGSFFTTSESYLNMGRINDRELKLRFSLQSINERKDGEDKLFFYTWYLAKPKNGGQNE